MIIKQIAYLLFVSATIICGNETLTIPQTPEETKTFWSLTSSDTLMTDHESRELISGIQMSYIKMIFNNVKTKKKCKQLMAFIYHSDAFGEYFLDGLKIFIINKPGLFIDSFNDLEKEIKAKIETILKTQYTMSDALEMGEVYQSLELIEK